MKRFVTLAILLAATLIPAAAQTLQDSLLAKPAVDSTLVGRDIFDVISSDGVQISQSQAVRAAFANYVAKGRSRSIQGYRIRVYYDNDHEARGISVAVARAVKDRFPEHSVYRSYESPNFKVTVGDFRSKDEALKLYNDLKSIYPSAYIIKENINFPL